ncbi:unnamed protein product [Bursaphelenchus xylophilus]|uniref:(pine wood nematode) hypothetical protein n=1 Tax=Bursaphelenchus xylophilus TaxID=6326 RepID=A0A1I7RJ89_BURXY|nr:unnamed protein product [Bursaphelenchus xylophilus]CAG9119471.1 unnamed protein product [Bursaphelenchus xylophilus]
MESNTSLTFDKDSIFFEDHSAPLEYRLAHQRQVGPGYTNRDGIMIPRDLRPIPGTQLSLYRRFRDPRTGRIFAVDLLNHWYYAKNDSSDFWLVEDTNSAGRPSREKMKWCRVSELPRTLFSQGVLDFRQIFGSDEYMRPFLKLCEVDDGKKTMVYPYDTYGNPIFPVCPILSANMSEYDKYKPCPNHKFYGDGHRCLAVDAEGLPIFPQNKQGDPVVPMSQCGEYPIYPSDMFGLGVIFPVDRMGTPIMAVDVEGRQQPYKNPFGHVELPTSLSSMATLVSLQRDGRYLNIRDVLRIEWLGIINERHQHKRMTIKRPIKVDASHGSHSSSHNHSYKRVKSENHGH